eukprot:CAMPEP_0172519568 /NCGR_PEP_ID=MMETSP1066-20121228/291495_1 /TAXON_ID=671091 /ORGANISM="Coscinodiscus wailesii, Strain CCMP2513" /LENGTH=183 /DNA_ID=CAMNT_0013302179 /DNA_START=417 /DNA_END=966 /DNA_ORIENTATION=+
MVAIILSTLDKHTRLGRQRVNTPTLEMDQILSVIRFTARACLASLSRVLNLSTAAASDNELEDDNTAKKRCRTRSLLVVLRTIASSTEEKDGDESGNNGRIDIRTIERDARRESKRPLLTPSEQTKRTPSDLETPSYTVLQTFGKGYEIRRYDPFSTCTVPTGSAARPANETTDAKVANPQLP